MVQVLPEQRRSELCASPAHPCSSLFGVFVDKILSVVLLFAVSLACPQPVRHHFSHLLLPSVCVLVVCRAAGRQATITSVLLICGMVEVTAVWSCDLASS